jgi:hypothetical protein
MKRATKTSTLQPEVNTDAFLTWLETVQCTKPFTLADAAELHALIHNALTPWPDTVVDVYTTTGDVVHVRVETYRGVLLREIPIV